MGERKEEFLLFRWWLLNKWIIGLGIKLVDNDTSPVDYVIIFSYSSLQWSKLWHSWASFSHKAEYDGSGMTSRTLPNTCL